MVEVLKPVALQTEQVVKDIVEVAADSRPANTSRLGFEIEDLAQDACLPVKVPIPPRPALPDRRTEVGDHPEAERTIGGDLLMATDDPRHVPEVAAGQEEERQVLRAAGRPRPLEPGAQRSPQTVVCAPVPLEQVEARRQAIDAVDEDAEMDERRPAQQVPGGHVGPGEQVVEQLVEGGGGDRRSAVEPKAAPPLADDHRRGHRLG